MSSPVIDPLELLTNKGDRKPRYLTNIYNPIACAAAGFGAAITLNWAFRKPVFSGIQRHVAMTIAGGLIGWYINGKRNETLATRDAILRHYVQLHPEDFPPVERKKYADVLEPWAPIR